MGVGGHEAVYSLGSEPCAQPVDQFGDFRLFGAVAVKAALRGGEGVAACHAKPDEIETEAGIERVRQGIEPFPEQAHDCRGMALGVAGFGRYAKDLAIGAEEARLEAASAFAASFEHLPDAFR